MILWKGIVRLVFWVLFALVLPLSIVGCGSQPTIQITSEPPGANIEVNHDYVGQAPCEVRVPMGSGFIVFAEPYFIRALPVIKGQYVQTKVFYPGNRVPTKVFFDMRLIPVPEQIDIQLKTRITSPGS